MPLRGVGGVSSSGLGMGPPANASLLRVAAGCATAKPAPYSKPSTAGSDSKQLCRDRLSVCRRSVRPTQAERPPQPVRTRRRSNRNPFAQRRSVRSSAPPPPAPGSAPASLRPVRALPRSGPVRPRSRRPLVSRSRVRGFLGARGTSSPPPRPRRGRRFPAHRWMPAAAVVAKTVLRIERVVRVAGSVLVPDIAVVGGTLIAVAGRVCQSVYRPSSLRTRRTRFPARLRRVAWSACSEIGAGRPAQIGHEIIESGELQSGLGNRR